MPKFESMDLSKDTEPEALFEMFLARCFDQGDVDAYLKNQNHDDITYEEIKELLNSGDIKTTFRELWDTYRAGDIDRHTPHFLAVDAFGKALAYVKNEADLALHLGNVPEDEIDGVEKFSSQMLILCQYFRQVQWND